MTKQAAEKLILTAEIAKRLKRTESAITKAARAGHFGDTLQRGPRGEYLFRWPAARDAWQRNTDTTRARPEHLAAETRPVVTAPAVDPSLVEACNDLTSAFLIDLWLKLTALPGFEDLEEIDRRELSSVFSTALDAMIRYGVPVSEAPWPPKFDPARVAEACRE